jgi:hypothetical protein
VTVLAGCCCMWVVLAAVARSKVAAGWEHSNAALLLLPCVAREGAIKGSTCRLLSVPSWHAVFGDVHCLLQRFMSVFDLAWYCCLLM